MRLWVSWVPGAECALWVCLCWARRAPGIQLFLAVELSPEYLRRLQVAVFLNATDLVHNWASATVSLLNIPLTCWGWSSAPKLQSPVFTEYLLSVETVSGCWGLHTWQKINALEDLACDRSLIAKTIPYSLQYTSRRNGTLAIIYGLQMLFA